MQKQEQSEELLMTRTLPALCIAMVLALTGLAQARDIQLTADPSVPAAAGKAELKHDRNGNLQLKVEVKHLAKPTSLTPPKQVYVVWIQGRGKNAENQGQLKVNDNLDGSFEGSTPYPMFDIFITAEDSPGASNPSGPQLLKGSMQP
jgi:hypothetical protein